MPQNPKNVLSPYFKTSFFPALNKKKAYEIVTLCVSFCFVASHWACEQSDRL